ncbi:MAG: leucine-rich repeat domain-containing protein [Prevotella sp.]|nr:leucine-rich repeat domain-containing protein [Prevotella sp.]MDY4217416.1 leucine-rich repeat domain-containing protein [Prevotella sp.]
MNKFIFIVALVLTMGFTANAKSTKDGTLKTNQLAPAKAPTTIPDGVIVESGVIKSWPANLIPEDGIITLDSSITGIGAQAFQETPLRSIILPSTLKHIDANAFAYCNLLQSIVIPNGVERLGESAFFQCHALMTVSLPKSITTMAPNAFAYCDKLQRLLIEEGASVIGESAFYGCSALTEVHLPNSLKTLGDNAFGGCTALKAIAVPSSIKLLLGTTFKDCSALETVNLAEGIDSIGRYVFQNCTALKTIALPKNLKSIDGGAFQGCTALESVIMPTTLTQISGSLFQDCRALQSIVIPAGVNTIHVSAFRGCSSLGKVILPEGVETINHSAFLNCVSLKTIELPTTLKTISLNSFTGCSAIEKVVCKATTPPAVVKTSFNKTPATKTLYVPATSIEAYQEKWKALNFFTIKAISEETPSDPTTPETASVTTAVYDFAANPWGIETAMSGDAPEVGKILDDQSLEVEGVKLTSQKINERYWNRIIDGKLRIYKDNTMTFSAPEKKVITKIEFNNVAYQCDLKEISQTGGTYACADDDADTPYVWTGRAVMVSFKSNPASAFEKITVTLESEVANDIQLIEKQVIDSGKVYNLNGVVVGSESTISTLPKGIYILNGKKFVK